MVYRSKLGAFAGTVGWSLLLATTAVALVHGIFRHRRKSKRKGSSTIPLAFPKAPRFFKNCWLAMIPDLPGLCRQNAVALGTTKFLPPKRAPAIRKGRLPPVVDLASGGRAVASGKPKTNKTQPHSTLLKSYLVTCAAACKTQKANRTENCLDLTLPEQTAFTFSPFFSFVRTK